MVFWVELVMFKGVYVEVLVRYYLCLRLEIVYLRCEVI